MPKAIRQENLYGAEDWSLVYTSFKNAEFISYDFDTLRQSMVNYMQTNYPEEFNDYIQSSEFIALLDLVAYVGQNLAFRMDLNARENILDTAEKRESVLRIARMLSYKPKRVRPASGFLKVTSVTTSEQILDSTGVNLSNKTIQWGADPSELEYERFLRIMNAAFTSLNKFGNPIKRAVSELNSNIFEVYRFNNLASFTNYPVGVIADGISLNLDLLPVDIDTGGRITQSDPNYETGFTVMYRNDGKGVGSTRTGFFFFAKEGYMTSTVQSITTPISNAVIDLPQTGNISEEDFYVQTIDESAAVVKTWKRVSNLDFSNIVINEFGGSDKDIYEVIYSDNDVTSIKFGDGVFTNSPTGTIRVWYRLSQDRYVRVKAGDIKSVTFDIQYVNPDNQTHLLTMTLDLQENMVTGLPAETTEEIKQNAPEAFYSKNRMVTADDYNGFLPTLNNDVLVLKAENRTFSGHSRYVDLKDPTGKNRPLIEFADDGYIYQTENVKNVFVPDDPSRRKIDLLDEFIEKQLSDLGLLNFYYGRVNIQGITGDAATTYFPVVNINKTQYYSTLAVPISSTDIISTITVAGINTSDPYDNFDLDGGLLQINNELFSYTSADPATKRFMGIKRATFGTAKATHAAGAQVFKVPDYRWRVAYNDADSSNGYISESNNSKVPQKLGYTSAGPLRSIRPGGLINLENTDGTTRWVTVLDIKGDGLGIEIESGSVPGENLEYTGLLANGNGVVEISKSVTTLDRIKQIIPPFTRTFDEITRLQIIEQITNKESFALKFDNTVPKWSLITNGVFLDAPYDSLDDESGWLINCQRTFENTGWMISVRQLDYVFGSEELMRFYNVNFAPTFNPNLQTTSRDKISLISLGSTGKLEKLQEYVITGYYVYDDGYTDNSKVKVSPIDVNKDRLPDDPEHFIKLVGDNKLTLVNYDEGDFTYTIPQEDPPNPADVSLIPFTIPYEVPGKMSLAFKWQHNVDIDQTLNPSLTNIIDAYVLTKSYNDEYVSWKKKNDKSIAVPLPQTPEELRDSFSNLTSYKMMTDEVIFHPVKFKPLFGTLADPEFQAQFKVVKNPKSKLTDSEIKAKIISAVDTFFTPGNFGFGEIFYFTELAAYIHTALSTDLNSVVIVPISQESKFGTLFQIQPDRNEVVTSVAGVNDIIVINEITDNNIRIGR